MGFLFFFLNFESCWCFPPITFSPGAVSLSQGGLHLRYQTRPLLLPPSKLILIVTGPFTFDLYIHLNFDLYRVVVPSELLARESSFFGWWWPITGIQNHTLTRSVCSASLLLLPTE